MLVKAPLAITATCAALLLCLVPLAHGRELYRYINTEGNVVVDDRIPPEYASRGYEVINDKGVVLRVVPRKLTVEELEKLNVQQQIAATAAEEEKRLKKWDESLLLRYSTVEDIEAARDRAIQELNIRVSILKSNTRFLKQQVENQQAAAADIERGGGTVDVKRLAAIEDLQAEIAATERSIVDREEEIALTEQRFQLDIDRFRQLLEVVELRRKATQQRK